MGKNIDLKQYDGSQVTPKDDAILYDMIVRQNGILNGCVLTWKGSNQIHIDAGYGMIKGRMFEVKEQTLYANLPDSIEKKKGYILISLDLKKADNPIEIVTCITDSAQWQQDGDINFINGVWEMPIAEYMATNLGINSFVETYETIKAPFSLIKNFSEIEALTEEGYMIDALLFKKQILTFENKSVEVTAWQQDTTYEDYPYRAAVLCNGLDGDYIPNVIFGLAECSKGILAPVAESATNKVYIYASEIPEDVIMIPTIQCIRKVG